jgi:carbamoyl-phosphate synthase large subunit
MEHVENAGVHSGDATMTIPPQALKIEVQKKIEECTISIVKALNIHGPYNIQYPVKDDVLNVIECNSEPRAPCPLSAKPAA